MKNKFKIIFGCLSLFLMFLAGYFVPQFAFGLEADYSALTNINFISYTPTPGPTPGPVPVPIPDPGTVLPTGFNPVQTGDILMVMLGLLGFVLLGSGLIVFKKLLNSHVGNVFTTAILAAMPVMLAGACFAGANEAKTFYGSEPLTSPSIEVYVNTEGGAIHYGEGEKSNVQTYTNNTGKSVFINEIAMQMNSGFSDVNVGTWTAKLDDGTVVFVGGAGDSQKLKNSIYLSPGESFVITWSTDALSEDLFDVMDTTPVAINYLTYDSVCTVTFESNKGTPVPAQTVNYGETATKPAAPSRENNTFVYWASDEALTSEFVFSTPVTKDLTLYAKWQVNEQYKEETKKEIEAEEKDAKEKISVIDGLTPEEKLLLEGKLDQLINDYENKLKNAQTQEEVDQLKAEFEEKVLNIEKEGLSDSMDNNEAQFVKDIEDPTKAPGLSESDHQRFEDRVNQSKEKLQADIEAADTFEESKEIKDQFDQQLKEELDKGVELGQGKIETKKSFEDTKEESKISIDTDFEEFREAAKEKFEGQLDQVTSEYEEKIADQADLEELENLNTEYNEKVEQIMQEAEELDTDITTKKAEIKNYTAEKTAEVEADEEILDSEKEGINTDISNLADQGTKNVQNSTSTTETSQAYGKFEEGVQNIFDGLIPVTFEVKKDRQPSSDAIFMEYYNGSSPSGRAIITAKARVGKAAWFCIKILKPDDLCIDKLTINGLSNFSCGI